MNSTPKKLTATLAGAVLLASAAYGIGTQTAGGGATAAGGSGSTDSRGDRPMALERHAGPAGLAAKLGVSEEKLMAALEEIRAEMKPPSERREERAAGLAKALGVPEAKVKAALEKLHPATGRRHRRAPRRFAAALAQELDLDIDDVKTALRKLRREHRAEHRARREAFVKALAERLDIPVAKVLAALPRSGPGGCLRRHIHREPGGPGLGPPPDAPRPGSFSPDGAPSGPGAAGLKL